MDTLLHIHLIRPQPKGYISQHGLDTPIYNKECICGKRRGNEHIGCHEAVKFALEEQKQ